MNIEKKPEKLKVVMDTNVLVSGLNFRGKERQILNLGREGKIEVYLSPFILEELEGVLQKKVGWEEEEAKAASRSIKTWSKEVKPGIEVSAIKKGKRITASWNVLLRAKFITSSRGINIIFCLLKNLKG